MKTNKQKVKELQLNIDKLKATNNELLRCIRQLSNIATNYDCTDVLKRLEMLQDYKDEVETLYNIMTSNLKDEVVYDMLKKWVLETRAEFKLKKELEL